MKKKILEVFLKQLSGWKVNDLQSKSKIFQISERIVGYPDPVRHRCVLSPFLSTICVNLINSHSRVDEGFTAGSCRSNSLFFGDDLAQIASSELGH